MTDIYYLGYEHKKKITECDKINSVNPLSFRTKDMKGQFEKGKAHNVWHLTIFRDADVLRKFANVFKNIRAEIEELVLCNLIKITRVLNLRVMMICQ